MHTYTSLEESEQARGEQSQVEPRGLKIDNSSKGKEGKGKEKKGREYCASHDPNVLQPSGCFCASRGSFQKSKASNDNASCVPRSSAWTFNKDCVPLFVREAAPIRIFHTLYRARATVGRECDVRLREIRNVVSFVMYGKPAGWSCAI